MKIALTLMMALCLIASVLSVMAQAAPYINEAFNREQMKNIKGDMVVFQDMNDLRGDIELGFCFVMPQSWDAREMDGAFMEDFGGPDLAYFYQPEGIREDIRRMEKIETEEEWNQTRDKILAALTPVIGLVRVNPEDKDSMEADARYKTTYQHMEHLYDNGVDKIFVGYNTDFTGFGLPECSGAHYVANLNAHYVANALHA